MRLHPSPPRHPFPSLRLHLSPFPQSVPNFYESSRVWQRHHCFPNRGCYHFYEGDFELGRADNLARRSSLNRPPYPPPPRLPTLFRRTILTPPSYSFVISAPSPLESSDFGINCNGPFRLQPERCLRATASPIFPTWNHQRGIWRFKENRDQNAR